VAASPPNSGVLRLSKLRPLIHRATLGLPAKLRESSRARERARRPESTRLNERPVLCHDHKAGIYFSILPGGQPFGCGHGGFAVGGPLPSFEYTGSAVPAAKFVFAVLISTCVGVGMPAIFRSSARYHGGARAMSDTQAAWIVLAALTIVGCAGVVWSHGLLP
jgi:hypothetical protein